jgi:hypothetical protein
MSLQREMSAGKAFGYGAQRKSICEGMEFLVPSAWYKCLIKKLKLKINTNVE